MPADDNIAAVVLAAGASRRFGEGNKLLAQIEGRTLIERVVDAVATGCGGDIVVVTGWDRDAVEEALRGRRLRFAHNAHWETGMGSSISVGIAALDAAATAAFIVPGDMPLLTPQLLAQLIGAFDGAGGDRIVFPTTAAGEQRNPVLWPRRYFASLSRLRPEAGAKALLKEARADCTPVAFASDAVWRDVDTPDDLDAARNSAAN